MLHWLRVPHEGLFIVLLNSLDILLSIVFVKSGHRTKEQTT